MADAVLHYTAQARQAGHKWGIPPAVLLGLINVESSGNPASVSPTGAFGLTQFEPATAHSYHVGTDATSQIEGAAHYLHDLGFSKDAHLALSKYNAGPGNPGAAGPYAANVLAAAHHYGSTVSSSSASSPTSTGATPAAGGGTVTTGKERSQLLTAGITIALVLSGAASVALGASRMLGLHKTPAGAQAAPQAPKKATA